MARPITRREVWVEMLLYPRHTIPTAVAPVVVASAVAWREGCFAPGPALVALGVTWLIQLGGVIADNYFNLRRHPDDVEHARMVRAIGQGLLRTAELRRAIAACYGFAVVAGLYLVYVGGLTALALGAAGIVASLAYSAGPFPLGDRGLGDPLFFLFFGLVAVLGSHYVQVAAVAGAPLSLAPPPGAFSALAIAASLPIAALTTMILVIDNLRDLEYDRSKHEYTLAVLMGSRATLVEYGALLGLAYAVPLWLWQVEGLAAPVLLPWASLPYALLVAWQVARSRSYEERVPLTPQAGQVLVAYAALFAAGILAA